MAITRSEITGRKAREGAGRRQLSERLTYTVPEAGRLLGLGRNAAYDAANRGDIPTLRIGRLLLVPKIPFHRMLEMTATGSAASAETTDAVAKLPTAGAKGEGA
jgi:excisionase family DNA binding protein